MWIRSQDRKILTEIHNLDIDDINQIWDGSSLLGKYSSEEKALKVLDEIKNAIENTNYYNIDNFIDNFCLGTYALRRGPQVYEMPQDDEVEV